MLKSRFTRRLAVMFGAIGLLVALVLLVFQFTGIAAQSVSAGIVFPVEHVTLLMFCFILGGLSINLRNYEMLVLPLSFLFMLIASLGIQMGFLSNASAEPIAAGAVCSLVLATFLSYGLRMVALVLLSGLAAYAVARMPQSQIVDGIEGLYFMIGVAISTLILLASGVCFSLTTKGLAGVKGSAMEYSKPSPIVYRPMLTIL